MKKTAQIQFQTQDYGIFARSHFSICQRRYIVKWWGNKRQKRTNSVCVQGSDMHNWFISSRQRHWIIINKSAFFPFCSIQRVDSQFIQYSTLHSKLYLFSFLFLFANGVSVSVCVRGGNECHAQSWNKRNYIWYSFVWMSVCAVSTVCINIVLYMVSLPSMFSIVNQNVTQSSTQKDWLLDCYWWQRH